MSFRRKLIRIIQFCKYVVAYIISRFYTNENIWLLSERGTDARDNSYCFFIFLMNNSSDAKPYFAITNDSPDKCRLKSFSNNLVEYGSFLHYVVYCRAKVLISTHIYGYAPVPSLFQRLDRIFHINEGKFCIMLQHGITKDYIPSLNFSNTKVDLMVCGAKPEYDYMQYAFGYPKENVQYLGFCRFDSLKLGKSEDRIILVMPTWRRWLTENNIANSEYINVYNELINNKTILYLLREYDYKLVFYPHHEIQPYIELLRVDVPNDRVIVADKYHYDVQDLLNQSSVLITDYSSVFFDFAYMRKPVIFYQFDQKRYRTAHYAEGYFRYEDSFGPVVLYINDLIDQIRSLIIEGCLLKNQYEEKCNEFFPLTDHNNCRRTYSYIKDRLSNN